MRGTERRGALKRDLFPLCSLHYGTKKETEGNLQRLAHEESRRGTLLFYNYT